MIELKNVSKSFGDKKVLNDISLTIPKGKITCIYGESGCGKSTISKMITGLTRPNSGTITLSHFPLWEKEYNREIGIKIQMVYQQPEASLDPSMRVGKSLEEILKYHTKLNKRERMERINEILQKLGLKETILSHYPYQISGGEAQRICLARCLLLDPEVLILDEATSMLDKEMESFILNWLKREFLKEDHAILFISHDRELADFYSDILYTIENGEIINEKEANRINNSNCYSNASKL